MNRHSMKTFYATLAAILVAAVIIYGAVRGKAYYDGAREEAERRAVEAESHATSNRNMCYVEFATSATTDIEDIYKWLDQHSYSSAWDKERKTKGYNNGPIEKSLMSDSELKTCEQAIAVATEANNKAITRELNTTSTMHATVTDGNINSVYGVVTNDKTGAVSGAPLIAVNDKTKAEYSTTTNEKGEWRFDNLPAGTYTVITLRASNE